MIKANNLASFQQKTEQRYWGEKFFAVFLMRKYN